MDFIIFTFDDRLRDTLLKIFKFVLADMDIDFVKLFKDSIKSINELGNICNDDAEKVIFVNINDKRLFNEDWTKCLNTLSQKYSNITFVILSKEEINAGIIFKNDIRVKYFINIIEDDLEIEIRKIINILCKEFYNKDEYIVAINENQNVTKIFLKDILFIETIKGKHKCVINHSKGKGILRIGINELILKLDSRFILCRPSTIANKENIIEIDFKNNIFYFNKDLSCTFSRNNKKKIKNLVKGEMS
ncbi:LytTR family transcriptional regulator DNA-binding domain-containing protein [Clostridium sp. DSM 8431]|uniref:LytTR family transcriptional regulator DNA-binding domain-containing protein n=1 Tax=Clostridium sp. DSM 8431 TaxID=1761781 RepID=UPI0011136D40|nr:LytTR family transcriptional regulator DNA-binding domain-containing protein [Clostridium sp. DSM 8431]